MKKLISFLLLSVSLTIASFAQSSISKGTSVKILEIAKSDSYYDDRADFVGQDATAAGELTKNADGYYSGTLETSTGRTIYFTSVKISVKGSSGSTTSAVKPKTTDAGAEFTGTKIPAGTRFKVLEVPTDDAYYSSKDEIEGQTGTTDAALTLDNGYVSGSIKLDNGKSYYFYKVKLGKVSGSAPAPKTKTTTTSTSSSASATQFITGTIKKGTRVYVADISPEDSYYSNRYDYVGKRGTVRSADMTMKEDGYYSGDFVYDDSSSAYFYKAKFSKTPVTKLTKPADDVSTSSYSSKSVKDDGAWDDAKNDDDIQEGDKVEITAISTEDSYYDNRDEYVGKRGTAGDDISYDSETDGYGGTVKLDGGSSPYFFLVKLKKISSGSSSVKSGSSSSSSASKTIKAGTRVIVTDVATDDSYYSNKGKYIRKKGKVADGLNNQGGDFYSGKIIFDDGTDAYFYKVKVTILN